MTTETESALSLSRSKNNSISAKAEFLCIVRERLVLPHAGNAHCAIRHILVLPVLSCLTWCDSLDKRVYRDGVGSRGLPLSMRGFCLHVHRHLHHKVLQPEIRQGSHGCRSR